MIVAPAADASRASRLYRGAGTLPSDSRIIPSTAVYTSSAGPASAAAAGCCAPVAALSQHQALTQWVACHKWSKSSQCSHRHSSTLLASGWSCFSVFLPRTIVAVMYCFRSRRFVCSWTILRHYGYSSCRHEPFRVEIRNGTNITVACIDFDTNCYIIHIARRDFLYLLIWLFYSNFVFCTKCWTTYQFQLYFCLLSDIATEVECMLCRYTRL